MFDIAEFGVQPGFLFYYRPFWLFRTGVWMFLRFVGIKLRSPRDNGTPKHQDLLPWCCAVLPSAALPENIRLTIVVVRKECQHFSLPLAWFPSLLRWWLLRQCSLLNACFCCAQQGVHAHTHAIPCLGRSYAPKNHRDLDDAKSAAP